MSIETSFSIQTPRQKIDRKAADRRFTTASAVRTCINENERLTDITTELSSANAKEGVIEIAIDPSITFQTIEGFGGAFTEAAAVTLQKLPVEARHDVLRAYFDPKTGHRYTVCRTHINSCDFALGNYAHADTPGDSALKQYSLARDEQALLPLIRDAMKIAGSLKLFATPWSPPAWMKTNGQMNNGGKLRPECRDAWAEYYCRFIGEYERAGVPVWGLSVQNEPEATQTWDSCVYTAEEERDFVRDHLGPALVRNGLSRIKLLIWDHNRDRMYDRAKVVFDDPQAARYVWGTGFHWYCGDHFDNVQRVYEAWPDKALVFTEGCQEGGPHPGSIAVGERYARSMINDLNRGTCAWIDWNLALDEIGGPNHVQNYCSAPVLVDTARGMAEFQPSFYYIGHFSRFIVPGSRRTGLNLSSDRLEATAFLRPDGILAVVVSNSCTEALSFSMKCGDSTVQSTAPARSIQTICLNLAK